MSRSSVHRLQQGARAGRRVRQVRPDGRRCYQQAGSSSPSSSYIIIIIIVSITVVSIDGWRSLHLSVGVRHSEQQDLYPDQCGRSLHHSQHRTSDRPEGARKGYATTTHHLIHHSSPPTPLITSYTTHHLLHHSSPHTSLITSYITHHLLHHSSPPTPLICPSCTTHHLIHHSSPLTSLITSYITHHLLHHSSVPPASRGRWRGTWRTASAREQWLSAGVGHTRR